MTGPLFDHITRFEGTLSLTPGASASLNAKLVCPRGRRLKQRCAHTLFRWAGLRNAAAAQTLWIGSRVDGPSAERCLRVTHVFGWAVIHFLGAIFAAVLAYGILIPALTGVAHAFVFLFSVMSMTSLAIGLSRPRRTM